jgi:hypothetical protein
MEEPARRKAAARAEADRLRTRIEVVIEPIWNTQSVAASTLAAWLSTPTAKSNASPLQ